VSGTAQIVATMLLIEEVDEVIRKPMPESILLTCTASHGLEEEALGASRRIHDEEAFDPVLQN
jgi:hypothetical protein